VNRHDLIQIALSAAIAAALFPATTHAQDTQDATTPAKDAASARQRDAANSAQNPDSLEGIVVTGSASVAGVRKLDASYSITTATAEQIKDAAPSSTADLLKIVPGVWAESTGGQTGANIFVRGFPGTGDAPYVTMELDGSPLYPVPTLSFLENSTLFRLDDTVYRVEALRGGPSPIFSNGQPGVTVNFIQKTGMETPEGEGTARVTLGTEDLYRFDAYYGGKIAEDWYGSIGGFYREGDGIHDTQFAANKGGQLSGNLTHTFDNGSVMFYARHLDDKNAFYTATPLLSRNGGSDISQFPGFDARSDTLYGNDLRNLVIQVSPGAVPGTIRRNLADGRGADINMAGVTLDLDFSGWTLSNRANFTDGDTPTVALFTGTNPTTLGAYIGGAITAANGNPDVVGAAGGVLATSGSASFANGGGAVNPNQQVINAGMWVVDKHIKSFTDEVRFGREIFAGNTLTVGGYYAKYSADDHWYLGNNMLMTVENNAHLIDVTLNNGAVVSSRGFTSGPFYQLNASYDGDNEAAFVADEWKIADAWRIDAGIRVEHINVDGDVGNTASADLDGNPLTLYNNGASVPDGSFHKVELDKTHSSLTAGVNYELNEHASLFGRVNSGFLFPSFDNLRDGTNLTQKVRQYELGFKSESQFYSAYLTGFYNRFKGVPYQQFDENGNNVTSVGGAKAYGVEFEGVVRPFENFQVALLGDWTHAEYEDYGVYTGNQVQRQPKLQLRLTPQYAIPMNWGDLRLFATYTYAGKRFGDLANAQPLPSYYSLDIGAEANIGKKLSFRLSGTNVTNQFGLTEGNARIQGDASTGDVFLGRSIFGRMYTLSALYRF
jgi:outer membrane receptor protein involved in Fe transport